jgi:hypothetical protein
MLGLEEVFYKKFQILTTIQNIESVLFSQLKKRILCAPIRRKSIVSIFSGASRLAGLSPEGRQLV